MCSASRPASSGTPGEKMPWRPRPRRTGAAICPGMRPGMPTSAGGGREGDNSLLDVMVASEVADARMHRRRWRRGGAVRRRRRQQQQQRRHAHTRAAAAAAAAAAAGSACALGGLKRAHRTAQHAWQHSKPSTRGSTACTAAAGRACALGGLESLPGGVAGDEVLDVVGVPASGRRQGARVAGARRQPAGASACHAAGWGRTSPPPLLPPPPPSHRPRRRTWRPPPPAARSARGAPGRA